jgi:hypothetical protein
MSKLRDAVENALETFEQKRDCACDADFCCYFHKVEEQLRSALWAESPKAECLGCDDSGARPVTASNPHGYCEGCEEIWRVRAATYAEQAAERGLIGSLGEPEQGPHSCGGALATQKGRP